MRWRGGKVPRVERCQEPFLTEGIGLPFPASGPAVPGPPGAIRSSTAADHFWGGRDRPGPRFRAPVRGGRGVVIPHERRLAWSALTRCLASDGSEQLLC